MNSYWEELKSFFKNKLFIFTLALLMVIAFGYAAVNSSISADDMETDRYVGSGNMMLAAGRFGIWFWDAIQGGYQTDFSMDLLACFMTLFTAINLCILFRRVSGGKIGMAALTVFSGMFVSYPLILEIWEYTGSNVHIGGSMVFTSLSLLILHNFIHHGSWRKPWALIPVAAMMTLVCAGYESIVAVYIFLVFAVLALQVVYGTEREKKLTEIIRQGLIYAAFLVIGLVGRLIVHQLILLIMDLEPTVNGSTTITWGTDSPIAILKSMLLTWVRAYLLKSIIYTPLTIMLIACITLVIIGIFACKKHGAILLLPSLGMFLSLIILSLLQGTPTALRSCQVFAPFCGFTAMILVQCLQRKWLRNAALVGFACLFLYQASYINYFLVLNHHRSEQDAHTVAHIGLTLQTEFDREKPVIFVGGYSLSEELAEARSISENDLRWKLYKAIMLKAYSAIGKDTPLNRQLPETNVTSVINWSILAFKQSSMLKLFNYYGFDYIPADYDTVYEEATQYAENTNMPAYPYDGYIQDVGDYIIVHLQ